MSEDLGPTFVTITDEDGNDIELEFVDALEHNGQKYMAFFPAEMEDSDEENSDTGLVILKAVTENGEEVSVLAVPIVHSPPVFDIRIMAPQASCAVEIAKL